MNDPAVVLALHSLLVYLILAWVAYYGNDHPIQQACSILEGWYHHIVLTHICKLGSFLLFYCQKSGNEPDECKKRYSRIRIFTFYLFEAEQYTSGRVQNVGCVYCSCCSYYAAAHNTWKSRLTVVDFNWRHLIAEPSTRTSVRCKDLVVQAEV